MLKRRFHLHVFTRESGVELKREYPKVRGININFRGYSVSKSGVGVLCFTVQVEMPGTMVLIKMQRSW